MSAPVEVSRELAENRIALLKVLLESGKLSVWGYSQAYQAMCYWQYLLDGVMVPDRRRLKLFLGYEYAALGGLRRTLLDEMEHCSDAEKRDALAQRIELVGHAQKQVEQVLLDWVRRPRRQR